MEEQQMRKLLTDLAASLEELAAEDDALRATLVKLRENGNHPKLVEECERALAVNGTGRAEIEEMRDGVLRMIEDLPS